MTFIRLHYENKIAQSLSLVCLFKIKVTSTFLNRKFRIDYPRLDIMFREILYSVQINIPFISDSNKYHNNMCCSLDGIKLEKVRFD